MSIFFAVHFIFGRRNSNFRMEDFLLDEWREREREVEEERMESTIHSLYRFEA